MLGRKPFSRRSFLRNGTLGAAAVGVLGSMPGLSGLLGAASAETPAISEGAEDAQTALPEISGPIVAHVTDVSAGDVSLYIAERQVSYRDPILVQHLLRAAR
jgi:hypothetical protein